MKANRAFTLAELLIALAILGVIATFTIPKVLSSQQSSQSKAIAKEAASMISGALAAYKNEHTLTSTMTAADLTPYMNYVAVDTAAQMDQWQGGNTNQCNATTWGCLRLHNGALLGFHRTEPIGCTASNCAVYFHIDPDGQPSASSTGPYKSLSLFIYSNGRITTWGQIDSGTQNNGGSYNPQPSYNPPWFDWN